MPLDLGDPELHGAVERLAPYSRHALAEAARFAERLHADELVPEHLLAALLLDEDTAAARAVVHAFADPETIATEVVALCPGILVVGSSRSLPFSVRAVRALFAARAAAASSGASRVEPAHLLAAAMGELDAAAAGALSAAGLRAPDRPPAGAPSGEPALPDEGPLFRHFAEDAKKALSRAGHLAAQNERSAVSPAHLVAAALEVDAALGEQAGLSGARARLAVGGRDADETPLEPRALSAGRELLPFLAALPPGADTVEVLGGFLEHGSREVRQLLVRQKVTTALVRRSSGVFRDPEPPAAGHPSTGGSP